MKTVKAIDGSPVLGLAGLAADVMIDLKALADALGVCQRTARRMVRAGELPPPITLGRRKVWTAGRVRAWLDRRAADLEREADRERMRIHRLGT